MKFPAKLNLNGDTLLICRANPDADTIQECGWLSSVMDKATADSKKVMLFGYMTQLHFEKPIQ